MLEKVCIIGSGNWGSAIAKIIGQNVCKFPDLFSARVNMWVFEEKLPDQRLLSEVINTEHENCKYLPGIKLPTNVFAVTDLKEAVKDASLLVFVVPHQFVGRVLSTLKEKNVLSLGKVRAVSLIKGIESDGTGEMRLISSLISKSLEIDVSVLMGANIATEVAREQFCESTLGYSNLENAKVLQKMLNDPRSFRVAMIEDVAAVELCGALKNVVAVAAGFVDGLRLGENTKAAIIRIGLLEIVKFCKLFFPATTKEGTFFESCGVADLITTCFGGRNRKVAEVFAIHNGTVSIAKLEEEMLNGQKLQGPDTAKDVFLKLKAAGKLEEFPLFVAVYRVCFESYPIRHIFDQ